MSGSLRSLSFLLFCLLCSTGYSQVQVDELRQCAVEAMYRENYDEAIEYFTRVIELVPGDSIAYFDRGMAKELKGDLKGAIDDYTKQIAVDHESVDSYFLRGMVWDKLGEREKAIIDYTKVIELEFDNADAHLFRGIDLEAKKKFLEALKDFNDAITINPDVPDYYYHRAKVELLLKDHEHACADYQQYRSMSGEKELSLRCQ